MFGDIVPEEFANHKSRPQNSRLIQNSKGSPTRGKQSCIPLIGFIISAKGSGKPEVQYFGVKRARRQKTRVPDRKKKQQQTQNRKNPNLSAGKGAKITFVVVGPPTTHFAGESWKKSCVQGECSCMCTCTWLAVESTADSEKD